jgi:hypothetical protein
MNRDAMYGQLTGAGDVKRNETRVRTVRTQDSNAG